MTNQERQLATAPPHLPRVTIQFCTQCKWMLRAAYYAQELLSTFSVALGEVALQPATGGVFTVDITVPAGIATGAGGAAATTASGASEPSEPAPGPSGGDEAPPAATRTLRLWDRKLDGGFPETKELKRRVRDVIQPGRDLGHVDRDHHRRPAKKAEGGEEGEGKEEEGGERGKKSCVKSAEGEAACEDCQ
ncbi:hypothetical protein VTJ83DRAFT_1134 [Remersonia thermophila]|uniref:Uncharacterized protein n=1 Tax=Remersonia thermophila TaxID=72144 RepID=A0ABR4DN78_9PEZI